MPCPYSLRWIVPPLMLTLMLVVPVESRAQEAEQDVLREALAAGDARAVLRGAASRVEVSLFGESSQYSRSQAVYVLQDFFESYPPRRFDWQDTSQSGQNRFWAGRYWHEAAERPMRVHVRLRHGEEAGWQLQEVRIERR